MKKPPKCGVVVDLSAARKRRQEMRDAGNTGADQGEPEKRPGEMGKLLGWPGRGRGIWLFISAFPHLAREAIASDGLPDEET